MINILKLGSKESAGVIFKGGICAELRIRLCLENDWYSYNITESGYFESDCPETKFQSITS